MHKICMRNPSTNQWKAFCLEYGDSILGYGDNLSQALTNMENDLIQKSFWANEPNIYLLGRNTKIIRGKPSSFYHFKCMWYELRWLLQKIKPSENLYISVEKGIFFKNITFRP